MLESKGLYLRPWRLHLVEDLRQERRRSPTARLLDPPRTRRHIRFFLVWTFFPATKLTNHTSCLPDDQTGGIISHNNRNPMSAHLVIGHSAYENWRLGSWICWKDVTYLTVPSVPPPYFSWCTRSPVSMNYGNSLSSPFPCFFGSFWLQLWKN